MKDNPNLNIGLLVGVLHVSLTPTMTSGLNNLDVCTLTRTKFSKSFGLRKPELFELFRLAPPMKIDLQGMMNWYNGYNYNEHIYFNAWSTMQCLALNGALGNHGFDIHHPNPLVDKILLSDEMQENLHLFISGKSMTLPNLHSRTEPINWVNMNRLEVLFLNGYLSQEITPIGISSNVVIPNKQMKHIYEAYVLRWVLYRGIVIALKNVMDSTHTDQEDETNDLVLIPKPNTSHHNRTPSHPKSHTKPDKTIGICPNMMKIQPLLIILVSLTLKKSTSQETCVDTDDFQSLLFDDTPFVDKSLFIRDFLETNPSSLLIVRPSGWGKSINLDMLKRFFQPEVDSKGDTVTKRETINGKLFLGGLIKLHSNRTKCLKTLQICNVFGSIQQMGKHPVIFVKMKNTSGNSYEEIVYKIKTRIKEAFEDHRYLLNSSRVSLAQDLRKYFGPVEESGERDLHNRL
ncbi:hypothetical protein U1Q18_051529 [Sarracenia purpurea var. burkii]